MSRRETLNTGNEQLKGRPVDGDVRTQRSRGAMKVCIVGASGKLGQYMVQLAQPSHAVVRVRQQDQDVSLLRGPVVDQAALHGLLRKVRDLGLPLLAVALVATDVSGQDGL